MNKLERLMLEDIRDRISEHEFLTAYYKYPASKWSQIVFRYYSKSTVKKDKWAQYALFSILILLFVLGFIGMAANFHPTYSKIIISAFSAILVPSYLFVQIGVILNEIRVKKIRKLLGGISKEEYNILVNLYLT